MHWNKAVQKRKVRIIKKKMQEAELPLAAAALGRVLPLLEVSVEQLRVHEALQDRVHKAGVAEIGEAAARLGLSDHRRARAAANSAAPQAPDPVAEATQVLRRCGAATRTSAPW